MADQHASLTAERWAAFTRDQQVLMIANEMHRASKLFGPDDADRLRAGYERVLRLTDLTAVGARGGLLRELRRWRELVAALYVAPAPAPADHRAALRCLLRFTPVASAQIPFVLGS